MRERESVCVARFKHSMPENLVEEAICRSGGRLEVLSFKGVVHLSEKQKWQTNRCKVGASAWDHSTPFKACRSTSSRIEWDSEQHQRTQHKLKETPSDPTQSYDARVLLTQQKSNRESILHPTPSEPALQANESRQRQQQQQQQQPPRNKLVRECKSIATYTSLLLWRRSVLSLVLSQLLSLVCFSSIAANAVEMILQNQFVPCF